MLREGKELNSSEQEDPSQYEQNGVTWKRDGKDFVAKTEGASQEEVLKVHEGMLEARLAGDDEVRADKKGTVGEFMDRSLKPDERAKTEDALAAVREALAKIGEKNEQGPQ